MFASARLNGALPHGNLDGAARTPPKFNDPRERGGLNRSKPLINAYPQFRTEIDGVPIHFIHVRGKGPNPKRLILSHGWPWTFWEYHKLIAPLSDLRIAHIFGI
jgi:hypothetical protein